jgi:hypothetical protein
MLARLRLSSGRFLRRALAAVAWVLAGAFAAAPVAAQDSLRTHPGYVDLSVVETWFETPASLDISLDAPLLALVARAQEEEDPEFARLMRSLTAIRVRGYPTRPADADAVTARTRRLAERLEAQGWTRAVYIRNTDGTGRDGRSDLVSVFVRRDDNGIAGLTLLVTDAGDESVFVNIVGALSPEQIATLGRGLGLDGMRSFRFGDPQR